MEKISPIGLIGLIRPILLGFLGEKSRKIGLIGRIGLIGLIFFGAAGATGATGASSGPSGHSSPSGPSLVSQAPETPEMEIRQPTLRKIHAEKDALVVQRLEFQRDKLPEKHQRRNNFAWAVAHVSGVDKFEYFAHSGIQSAEGLREDELEKIPEISMQPEHGRYFALCVNKNDVVEGYDCWIRTVDTEYKIIEDMAARIPSTNATGRVKLYTDLPPCASCWNAMKQFLAEYPGVKMSVLYRSK